MDEIDILLDQISESDIVKKDEPAPGRRDVLKRIGGAAVGAPFSSGALATTLAGQVAGQAVAHVATQAAQAVVKAPSFPTHVEHPKAGTGVVIPHQELKAAAHNMFRKDHGSDVRVTPHDMPDTFDHLYQDRAHFGKRLDVEKITGIDPNKADRLHRERGIHPMQTHGYTPRRMSHEEFVSATLEHGHPFSLLKHYGYQASKYHDNSWHTSNDEIENLSDGGYHHTATGQNFKDVHELGKYLAQKHGVTHVTQWSKPDNDDINILRPSDSFNHDFFQKHHKTGEDSWSQATKDTNWVNTLFSQPHSAQVQRDHSDAYGRLASSGAASRHYEDHGDVVHFTNHDEDKFREFMGGTPSHPSKPGYDHEKWKSAVEHSLTDHFVVENPFHWNNLRPGENSPADKRHFDAMHVTPEGKVTRFRVPFDPVNRDVDVENGAVELSRNNSDWMKKAVETRYKALAGSKTARHHNLAMKSAGFYQMPNYYQASRGEGSTGFFGKDEDFELSNLKTPALAMEHFNGKGTVKTLIHPDGKWEVHTSSQEPEIKTSSHGFEQKHYGNVSFTHHASGESPADLRKALLSAKRKLGGMHESAYFTPVPLSEVRKVFPTTFEESRRQYQNALCQSLGVPRELIFENPCREISLTEAEDALLTFPGGRTSLMMGPLRTKILPPNA